MSAAVQVAQPKREAMLMAYRNAIADHIRAHTEGTNVNSKTLLTTEYLNHFNEVAMMLELLPSAPAEMAEDLAKWEHQTYEEHFEESGFRDKSLAIAAYRYAPGTVRHVFDLAVADLEQETVQCLRQVQAKLSEGDHNGLADLCAGAVPRLQDMIQYVAGIINGEGGDLMGEVKASEAAPDHAQSGQAKIDALFD